MQTQVMEPITKLSRDLRVAATTLSHHEARFLVDAYYQMQDNRIRADGQIRSMSGDGEPCAVLDWLSDQNSTLETQIRGALKNYAAAHPVGEWLMGITGIGPVIAAGLLAHIDIKQAPTVGHIWRYAGLDPTQRWEKKTKRPWNAQLKVLCWKAGESFVKVKGNPKDVYGHIYEQRKDLEALKNEAGDYAEQAREKLERFKIDKKTEAYKHYAAGRLPPGHIHARAKRYAVKLFLAHLHDFWYRHEFGKEPPLPYAIAILGHAHLK